MYDRHPHPKVHVEVDVKVLGNQGRKCLHAAIKHNPFVDHGLHRYCFVRVLEEPAEMKQDGHHVDGHDGFDRVLHRAEDPSLHRVHHVDVPGNE